MKILVISYWFPPSSAIGAKRWGEFYELSRNDDDLDIEILTANWKNHDTLNSNVHYIGEEVQYKPPYLSKVKINYFNFIKHPAMLIRSIDKSITLDWYKKSKAWIDKQTTQYDLIISSYKPVASIVLGNYAKNKYKVPHIVDLRDLISIQGQKQRIPFIHFLDKQIDKFIMKDVDSIFVTSPISNKKAQFFYRKNTHTIFNGISNKVFKKDVSLSIDCSKTINILYMGTLGINRNPSTILNIFNQYCQNNKEISICIKFASQSNPFDFIDKEHIKNIKVIWLGYLSSEELLQEKNSSDAFIVLEDLKETGSENVPAKIFEYLHCEKPIILSCHEDAFIVKLIKETNSGKLIKNVEDLNTFFKFKIILNIEAVGFYTREHQYQLMKQIVLRQGIK